MRVKFFKGRLLSIVILDVFKISINFQYRGFSGTLCEMNARIQMMTESVQPDWKSYLRLLVLQTQNAFNDKAAQFLIIPLAAWLSDMGGGYESMPHLLAVLIVLPYLLLAPTAGWCADRFSKTRVIQMSALLQTVVLGGMLFAVLQHSIWGAVAAFFALSVQSTLLNLAKRGIVKELMGSEKLGAASGILEMCVVFAVCIGQILAGYWFANNQEAGATGWEAMAFPVKWLLVATVIPVALSFTMRRSIPRSTRKWENEIAWSHFKQLSLIWSDRNLKLASLGKAFFWGFGGFLNLIQITMAKELAVQTEQLYGYVLAQFMIAASAGIIFGGVVASIVSRKKIELGLIPVAGFTMLVGTMCFLFSDLGSTFMFVSLFISGFGGAMFLVPVNAWLQECSPEEQRGNVLAGASVLDCIAGLLAVALQLSLHLFGAPYWLQLTVLAVIISGVTIYVSRLLPKATIRFVVLSFFKLFYRVRGIGLENMPKEGGVLLTPNHVTYVDSLILSCISPRPVRFLMIRECFDKPFIGWFARFADTVPISSGRAKEAIQIAADALKEGSVVCIFPEGQLTRTGALCELKRGYEMIARRASCPVLPVYMDGIWGSIFSFERAKFFFKIPRKIPFGVRVAFGAIIQPKEANPSRLNTELYALSNQCMKQRKEFTEPRWLKGKLAGGSKFFRDEYKTLQGMGPEELKKKLFNALQLRELALITPKKRVWIDPEHPALDVLLILVRMMKWKISAKITSKTEIIFSSKGKIETLANENRGVLLDANGSLSAGTERFPSLVEDELFVTFSMPDPPVISEGDRAQPGWKSGTMGRILPAADYQLHNVDEEGFLRDLQDN